MEVFFQFFDTGLLSEEQCKARDARRKAKQRYTQNVNESSSEKKPALNPECNSNSGEATEPAKAQSPPEVKFSSSLSPYAIIDPRPIVSVSEDTRKLVEKLVKLQDKFEFPEESKVNSAIVSFDSESFISIISYLPFGLNLGHEMKNWVANSKHFFHALKLDHICFISHTGVFHV